jgi:methyltransferase-like protein/ubiquinone/menaquinone biosynthesis C-methylase UbiE
MSSNPTLQPYESIPYPGLPYAQSHPAYLGALAALFGMAPAPAEQCRVLELGCGSGDNLIPMSEELPASTFVGIDAAPTHISAGQRAITAHSLRNITLLCQDIRDTPPDLGTFDYIIAHGVYSWVSPAVQDALLATCRRALAPHGIAYVSYNTYPGWHMLGMLREMMLYHTWEEEDPHQKAARAAELLNFLGDSIPNEHRAYRDFVEFYITFLQHKIERAGSQSDAFLIHDELAEINSPLYFSQFVGHAGRHGLQYLTETDVAGVMPGSFPPAVAAKLRAMSRHLVEMEQYMDFLRGRTFRETLLCHQQITLDRVLRPERITSLAIGSPARPLSESPDISSVASESFRAPSGGTLALDHPLSKAALLHLGEVWPRALSFPALVAAAHARQLAATLPTAPPSDAESAHAEQVLAANLLKAFTLNTKLMRLRSCPPRLAPAIGNQPTARPLARLQARAQHHVTSMLHERIPLNDTQRVLLPLLDGTRDRAALLDALAPSCPLETDELEQQIQQLERLALLVA